GDPVAHFAVQHVGRGQIGGTCPGMQRQSFRKGRLAGAGAAQDEAMSCHDVTSWRPAAAALLFVTLASTSRRGKPFRHGWRFAKWSRANTPQPNDFCHMILSS